MSWYSFSLIVSVFPYSIRSQCTSVAAERTHGGCVHWCCTPHAAHLLDLEDFTSAKRQHTLQQYVYQVAVHEANAANQVARAQNPDIIILLPLQGDGVMISFGIKQIQTDLGLLPNLD